MNRIHLCPSRSRIRSRAGEVIERPASVLKELLENSLDAGATQIDVQIGAGGRSLVAVTDNGFGMSKDDALLCLERHATSKLRESDDLDRIASYGFRGEAIPSIASVSRFRLRTRERDALAGTELVIDGGKLREVREVGAGAGGRRSRSARFSTTCPRAANSCAPSRPSRPTCARRCCWPDSRG